jgi:outer membrane protein assembly factor BamB
MNLTRYFHLMKIVAIVIAACSATALADLDWPEFRGPTGQGLSTATHVPLHWSAETNVAWKTEIPGRGWSSPVLSKGKLYLTTAVTDADTSGTSLHVICIDAANGRILWDTSVFQPDPTIVAAMHRKNSPASPTSIVTNDRLYVHFGPMGTAALDLAGAVIWRQTELSYKPVHGTGGSPTLVDGTLIFSCDGEQDTFVAALDAKTGAVKWKTPRNSPAKKQFSFSTPLAITVDGATQIISPGSGFVGAYEPHDGHELWRVTYGEGYSVVPRPVFAHGLLFVSSGFDRPVLYAIKPAQAKGDATATNIAWTQDKGAPCTPSTLSAGDELYFVSDGGIVSCVNAMTGELYWSERLAGNFSASPVAAEGRIYFQNETGVTYVVKAGKTFELIATNDLAEPTLASLAVTNGAIFIRSERYLRRIKP